MRIIITLCFIVLLSPFGRAYASSGTSNDLNLLVTVTNESEYIKLKYEIPNPANVGWIPISNDGLTFFVPVANFTSYLDIDGVIFGGGPDTDNSYGAELKIQVINGSVDLSYLSEVYDSYKSGVQLSSLANGGVSINIPKRIFTKNPAQINDLIVRTEMKALVKVHKVLDSCLSQGVCAKAYDPDGGFWEEHTITIGKKVSGLGVSGFAGFAADDKGLGIYGTGTPGDVDFGWSLDVGIFNGDLDDIESTDFKPSLVASTGFTIPSIVAINYYQPLDGNIAGAGWVISIGPQIDIPSFELSYTGAFYVISDSMINDFLNNQSTSDGNNSSGSGENNDWDPNADHWTHDDSPSSEYDSDFDPDDWDDDDDANAGYF